MYVHKINFIEKTFQTFHFRGSLHSDGGGSDEGISVKPAITTKRKTVRDLPPLPKIPSDAGVYWTFFCLCAR